MPPYNLVGLGMATVDFLTLVPRLPQPDEVYPLDRMDIQGGGPVATALAAAGKLGTPSAFIGAIGDDNWGNVITADFERYGVATEAITRRAEATSPRSIILIERATGKRSILYSMGTAADLTLDEVPGDLIRGAAILHLDGFNIEAAVAAAKMARGAGVLVSLDGGAGETWPGLDQLLPLVDLLVVARQFAAGVTGEDDPEAAGPALRGFGARQVAITDGANGAWFWSDEDCGHQPAFPVSVVDTTGAGDTFHGAYLHAVLSGASIAACVRFASATAALKCTQLGGRCGLPGLKQVDAFLTKISG